MKHKLTVRLTFTNTPNRREIYVRSFYGRSEQETTAKLLGFITWRSKAGWKLVEKVVLESKMV